MRSENQNADHDSPTDRYRRKFRRRSTPEIASEEQSVGRGRWRRPVYRRRAAATAAGSAPVGNLLRRSDGWTSVGYDDDWEQRKQRAVPLRRK